ncbi:MULTISPECIES: DUF3108 domain-containing protein [unclassified Luteimonas]|uniref:DUF3108 domain-containing protein n=1 Tax=unclassified Luteimonas TaxID=2629088 RepID=UPI001615A594|nr:DUF3108 domain-containing protein [Luteimonas sp. RC10]MBB3344937.1 hypothetical protein [Luteimonas sp. RC10]
MPQTTRRPRLLAACGAALLSLATLPALALEPFTASYQTTFMGLRGQADMKLAREGSARWKYSLNVTGAGARLEQSTVFEANGDQWRPISSTDSQRGESGLAAMLVKRRSVNATYDWNAGEARWSGDVKDDQGGPVKLQSGDLDGMLMNLVLVRDVQAGRSPLRYRLVEDGRSKRQVFERQGTEAVTVGGRTLQATKVVRTDGRREIVAWIVDDLPVPARLLQRRDGSDHIDMRLQSVN